MMDVLSGIAGLTSRMRSLPDDIGDAIVVVGDMR